MQRRLTLTILRVYIGTSIYQYLSKLLVAILHVICRGVLPVLGSKKLILSTFSRSSRFYPTLCSIYTSNAWSSQSSATLLLRLYGSLTLLPPQPIPSGTYVIVVSPRSVNQTGPFLNPADAYGANRSLLGNQID